jgi:hypothetical protein
MKPNNVCMRCVSRCMCDRHCLNSTQATCRCFDYKQCMSHMEGLVPLGIYCRSRLWVNVFGVTWCHEVGFRICFSGSQISCFTHTFVSSSSQVYANGASSTAGAVNLWVMLESWPPGKLLKTPTSWTNMVPKQVTRTNLQHMFQHKHHPQKHE